MKTAKEILDGYDVTQLGEDHEDLYNSETIESMIREYAEEVIDEILSRPQMIYVDESGEAVYSYAAFESFKKEMIK